MHHADWLTEDLKEDLRGLGTLIKLDKNNVFIQEDMEHLYSYILLRGRVRIIAKSDPYSDELHADMILNDLEAVDVIGEICAIDGQPHSSLVETITDCELFRLRAADFRAVMDCHKGLRDHVMLRLCEKIRNANDRLRDNCVLNAQLRVTREIIRLAEERRKTLALQGRDEAHIKLELPKHHVLASRCGVTRETVSRVVGRLIKDEIMIKDEDGVIIQDMQALGQAWSK